MFDLGTVMAIDQTHVVRAGELVAGLHRKVDFDHCRSDALAGERLFAAVATETHPTVVTENGSDFERFGAPRSKGIGTVDPDP